MSSTLTLKVATVTSAVTLNNTDVNIANIIRLFVADKMAPIPDGLTQAQQNQLVLDAARDELLRYMRQEAAKNRLRELAAQEQAIRDGAVADTAI